MWPFRKKPEPKRFKCPLHGDVHGVFPTFADFTVNIRLCEQCIGVMFIKNAEEVVQTKKTRK